METQIDDTHRFIRYFWRSRTGWHAILKCPTHDHRFVADVQGATEPIIEVRCPFCGVEIILEGLPPVPKGVGNV